MSTSWLANKCKDPEFRRQYALSLTAETFINKLEEEMKKQGVTRELVFNSPLFTPRLQEIFDTPEDMTLEEMTYLAFALGFQVEPTLTPLNSPTGE